MSRTHGGYDREQLKTAGIEESTHDRIKFMSGFQSLEDVQAAAPATEGESGSASPPVRARTRSPRLSKEEQEKIQAQAEFERLKPIILSKWRRRLRMFYGVWAKLADDPKINLSDGDVDEGSEMHYELMVAMGWVGVSKIEAWIDLAMWHGAMVLSRSELGTQLLAQFRQPNPDENAEQVQ